jgi:hypothetical protein
MIISAALVLIAIGIPLAYLWIGRDIVSYNKDMLWEDGKLNINLRNKTNSTLQISIATSYFTTFPVEVGPKESLSEFPVENMFIDLESNVFVVCDGYGDERAYEAVVTVPYARKAEND